MMLELRSDVSNSDRVLNDVRSAVDQIPSFPVLAEDPDVKLTEMRETVIRVGVVGPNDRDQDARSVYVKWRNRRAKRYCCCPKYPGST